MQAQRLLRHIGGLMPVLCLIAARCQRNYNVWLEQAGQSYNSCPSLLRMLLLRGVWELLVVAMDCPTEPLGGESSVDGDVTNRPATGNFRVSRHVCDI